PAVIFGVGFLMTYTTKPLVLYGTRWVLILVYVTLMIPFSTRMQLGAMAGLGDAYTEASRASGARALRTNLQIVVPLLQPALGGAAALMFVLLTHEFAASLLVRAPTINVMGTILYDYYENGSYPLVACISLIMVGVTTAGVVAAIILRGGSPALNGRGGLAGEARAPRRRRAASGGRAGVPRGALPGSRAGPAPPRQADGVPPPLAGAVLRGRIRRPRVACR